MLYHASGKTCIAQTPEEHDALMPQGWDTVPAAVHLRQVPTPSAAMAASDPYGLGPLIRQILNEVLNERNIGRRPRDGTHG
jgi:hypothetical protein